MNTERKFTRTRIITIVRVIVSTGILVLGINWAGELHELHSEGITPVKVLYIIGLASCMYWADRLIGYFVKDEISRNEMKTLERCLAEFGFGGVVGWMAVAIAVAIVYGLYEFVLFLEIFGVQIVPDSLEGDGSCYILKRA